MCHSLESEPPAAPLRHAAPVELCAADGARSDAYVAVPAAPNGRNVVILPDVRGVHPYYRRLAERFAEAGFGAIAVDYYGRSAGVGPRDDDFDWSAHLPLVRPSDIALDVRAAAAHLTAVNPGPVFTVGFCFGGGQSWRLAADPGLSGPGGLCGAIGFYGRPSDVLDVVDRVRLPLLLLVAGADAATPQDEFHDLARRLTEAGAEHDMTVYDAAPHSFFDRAAGEWRDACDDAWRRVIEFTARHSADAPGSRFARGAARIRQLDGDFPQRRQEVYRTLAEIAPDLPRFAVEFAYGDVHSRPGLDAAHRELVTIGALVALGDTEHQLAAHLRSALHAGLSKEALVEAVMQTLPYAGFPRTVNAMLVAGEVLTAFLSASSQVGP